LKRLKLNNTRLLVTDFPATFVFYRDVMGLTPSYGSEDDVYTSFDTGTGTLALFKRNLMKIALTGEVVPTVEATPPTVDTFLITFNVPDIDELFANMVAKGVKFITLPTDRPEWGIRTAHLRDPEGNLVEIYSDLVRT
jgi:lactoylglutathione lyase